MQILLVRGIDEAGRPMATLVVPMPSGSQEQFHFYDTMASHAGVLAALQRAADLMAIGLAVERSMSKTPS